MGTSNTDYARETEERSAIGYNNAEGPQGGHHRGGHSIPNGENVTLFAERLHPQKSAKYFQEKVQDLNAKKAVVQIDFEENYTCF